MFSDRVAPVDCQRTYMAIKLSRFYTLRLIPQVIADHGF